ncbi:unnamed protein product [Durusdinium trenchii]|uniref:Uncharacterized protein n=1 Tax=Durusdinium trenchii TaxID=1381693 RepID=A0ABP0PI46_9DINO
MALAEDWESRACLRARARENGVLTMWPKPNQKGIPTGPACSLNSVPLTALAKWWVERSTTPRTVPIGDMREQVIAWRQLSALNEDNGSVALDAWGLKRLFSHCLRRWLSGSVRPRDPAMRDFWEVLDGAWGTPQAANGGPALQEEEDGDEGENGGDDTDHYSGAEAAADEYPEIDHVIHDSQDMASTQTMLDSEGSEAPVDIEMSEPDHLPCAAEAAAPPANAAKCTGQPDKSPVFGGPTQSAGNRNAKISALRMALEKRAAATMARGKSSS